MIPPFDVLEFYEAWLAFLSLGSTELALRVPLASFISGLLFLDVDVPPRRVDYVVEVSFYFEPYLLELGLRL